MLQDDNRGEKMINNLIYDEQMRLAMNKWGVSRFKFDEPIGNVTDSKGTAIGTITNATRVEGWNAEGYAMQFNGNGYVAMNKKVVPMGEKSIRFKIKIGQIPTQASVIFSECYYASGQYGTYAYVYQNTSMIVFNVHRNGTNILDINTGNLALNQWHDILFSWDGTTAVDGIRMFVNGELLRTNKASSVESNVATSNLHIGSYPDKNHRLINSQLDDLQFYNKALTPKDFTLNKTFILNSGEYKKYDATWQTVSTTTPTIEQFITDGMDSISPLLDRLDGDTPLDDLTGDFEVVTWTDEVDVTRILEMTVGQSPQLVFPTKDISLAGVETVDSIKLTATGNATVAISFDSGSTWKAYKNGAWETVTDASEGMTTSEINALTGMQIAEARGDSNFIRFSYSLSGDAEIDKVEMRVSMQGTEVIASSSDYELNYDIPNKTIVYTIKRDMTVSANYVDG